MLCIFSNIVKAPKKKSPSVLRTVFLSSWSTVVLKMDCHDVTLLHGVQPEYFFLHGTGGGFSNRLYESI